MLDRTSTSRCSIGPVVPLPAPKAVLDALDEHLGDDVGEHRKTPSAFELQFTLDNTRRSTRCSCSTGGAQLPIFRVIVIVTVNGTPDVLIDGVVTKQQVTPGTGRGPLDADGHAASTSPR